LDLQSTNDKDLRLLLGKIIDVAEYLYQQFITSKENFPEYDENEQKLNRKEEEGKFFNKKNYCESDYFQLFWFILIILDIDNIYLSQKIDTNQNSEWGPDDDMESGLNVNNF